MNHTLIRCDTAAQVDIIAAKNPHTAHTHTAYAASVTLADDVTYWWAA
jgi:hypothetical protein